MRNSLLLILITILLALLAGCKREDQTKSGKPANEIAVDFYFPKAEFSEGEAVCMRVVFRNETSDTISLSEYPLKNFEIVSVDAPPVERVQRAAYITPSRMWLVPGDSSWHVVSLTGFYENSGPGMFAPGTYMVKTHSFFYAGKYIHNRLRKFGYRDSTTFEVVEPVEEAAVAMNEYREIMESVGGLDSLVGNTDIDLPDEIREKLDSLAFRHPLTPIGQRILINDLGIWYRSVPISRYSKFFQEVPANCPCCLHRYVIDRMIKRYVLKREREDQLDVVEIGLEKFPPESPIGDYLRRAYSFRIEDGFLVR